MRYPDSSILKIKYQATHNSQLISQLVGSSSNVFDQRSDRLSAHAPEIICLRAIAHAHDAGYV